MLNIGIDVSPKLDEGEKSNSLEENDKANFTIINANARSLCTKIDSLIDCMEEAGAGVAVVTETWMKDGPALDNNASDLSLGAGIGMLNRNRRPLDSNGVAYGLSLIHI